VAFAGRYDGFMPEIGKLLVIVGGVILVVGLFLSLGLRIPYLGKLPGDISVDRGNVHFYFPIVTCLLLSLVLTILLSAFFRR
jgi:membrane protein implicated in regulation of membrane protease activity